MRHQYTPIFRDLLDSSLWACASTATRCVWITFLLDADPEGYIPSSVPGLARRANVTVEEARAAIAMLESPDPDSRTPDFEGRRVEKVPGGWRVLNFVAKRELAKHEAEKARKRRWANANGKRPPVANDNDAAPEPVSMRLGLDAPSENLDAPKPKPKPKPKPVFSEEDEERASAVIHHVLHELPDGYQPSEALRANAFAAGVKRLDHWIDKLRCKRIGGRDGIRADRIEEWLTLQLPNFRTWEETDDFKAANSRAAAASPRGFQGARPPSVPFEPEAKHEAFARRLGIDLNTILKGVLDDYPQPSGTVSRLSILGERLTVAAKQKKAGHPVTGKLTRAENEAWGPPPSGGSIPDVEASA